MVNGIWIAAALLLITVLLIPIVYAYPQNGPPITGIVTKVWDGDTIDAKLSNGENVRIRFALANTPERGNPGWKAATDFTKANCPVGSTIIMDPDQGQRKSFNRNVAMVFCPLQNQNQELVETGFATVMTRYCLTSEFATQKWTGCL